MVSLISSIFRPWYFIMALANLRQVVTVNVLLNLTYQGPLHTSPNRYLPCRIPEGFISQPQYIEMKYSPWLLWADRYTAFEYLWTLWDLSQVIYVEPSGNLIRLRVGCTKSPCVNMEWKERQQYDKQLHAGTFLSSLQAHISHRSFSELFLLLPYRGCWSRPESLRCPSWVSGQWCYPEGLKGRPHFHESPSQCLR